MENRTVSQRCDLVDNHACDLSIRKQCEVLSIPRSSLYYKPVRENAENLELMRLMDALAVKEPTYGVLRMQDELRDRGYCVNHKRIRRLMRKMGLEPIYPKRNLSKLGKAKYVYPYLLRDKSKIDRPNKAWAIDSATLR